MNKVGSPDWLTWLDFCSHKVPLPSSPLTCVLIPRRGTLFWSQNRMSTFLSEIHLERGRGERGGRDA